QQQQSLNWNSTIQQQPPQRYKKSFVPDDWTVFTEDISLFYAGKTPWMAKGALFFPCALPADGNVDLCIAWKDKLSKLQSIEILEKIAKGTHIDTKVLNYYKVKAFRVTPKAKEGMISIDGEKVSFAPFQVEVHEKQTTRATTTSATTNPMKKQTSDPRPSQLRLVLLYDVPIQHATTQQKEQSSQELQAVGFLSTSLLRPISLLPIVVGGNDRFGRERETNNKPNIVVNIIINRPHNIHPQPPHLPSLHLYRATLRFIRNPKQFPFHYLREKTKFNVRELFELYREEKDIEQVWRLIDRGQQDLEFLKAWMFVEPEIRDQIFRGFGSEKKKV
ncbi:1260_t:CDS:2, partial [Ambispora leptoticha]